MRILLTLDYELYFGPRPGSVARTLIEPTDAILGIAERHAARCVLFVDAGYLLFLQEPRRMFRRHFIDGMEFFAMLARAVLRRRSGTPAEGT